ncbi:hypothetical protein CROQUDRAFT_395959 [Cronartium quercuum f. sp. fusiforme G11]|uniref:Superoxide dismutase copper/zinc binding domain-containing protein n=1 Tax=Cronartium quercuum f. sp. fusiforme G11 TaxID=708437 RepID=A0A9P6N9L4_9BASI|nr:hypothetical protein CROQUDRAFT_395959 [Cronartium quercuum f. sp. fusiforme G11]
MLSTTLISVLLAATFWASFRAEGMLLDRETIEKEARHPCAMYDTSCTRYASAHVTGNYGVSGHFLFTSEAHQEDVRVRLKIEGLGSHNLAGQHYHYHVHVKPLDETHDCDSTGGHLNPAKLPETTVCKPKKLETCQFGDLSTKHGDLIGGTTPIEHSYLDSQLRFGPADISMVGRSVVIHDPTMKRIACGNVVFGLDGLKN